MLSANPFELFFTPFLRAVDKFLLILSSAFFVFSPQYDWFSRSNSPFFENQSIVSFFGVCAGSVLSLIPRFLIESWWSLAEVGLSSA